MTTLLLVFVMLLALGAMFARTAPTRTSTRLIWRRGASRIWNRICWHIPGYYSFRLRRLPAIGGGMPTEPSYNKTEPSMGVAGGGTATVTGGTGGTQATGTPLVQTFNRVGSSTNSAPPYDAFKLPVAVAGSVVYLNNASANPIQVFPSGSDSINGQANSLAVTQPPGSVDLYICASNGIWSVETGVGYSGSLATKVAQDGIVAHAGGGQGSATALTADVNRVITVATAADSSLLPVSKPGMQVTVINAAAASMNVFPATGEAINALGANAAFALAAGKTASFYCAGAGQWHALLGA